MSRKRKKDLTKTWRIFPLYFLKKYWPVCAHIFFSNNDQMNHIFELWVYTYMLFMVSPRLIRIVKSTAPPNDRIWVRFLISTTRFIQTRICECYVKKTFSKIWNVHVGEHLALRTVAFVGVTLVAREGNERRERCVNQRRRIFLFCIFLPRIFLPRIFLPRIFLSRIFLRIIGLEQCVHAVLYYVIF